MTYHEIANRIYISNTIYRHLKELTNGKLKHTNIQVTYRSISKDKDIKMVNTKNFATALEQCKAKVVNKSYEDYEFLLDIFLIL